MTDTALTLITDAMKEIRVLQAGETPTAADANDGLRRLNRMLDALNLEHLTCIADITATAALVPTQPVYTCGPAGDFNVVRPPEITRAWVRDASGQDIPLTLYTQGRWDGIVLKAQTDTYPYIGWYDPQYPLGRLNVWPVPTSTLALWIRFRSLLTAFGDLSTVVALPPGYAEYYTLRLAKLIAPYFGAAAVKAAGELQGELERIEAAVKRQNLPNRMQELENDAPRGGEGGRWNIETDEPVNR